MSIMGIVYYDKFSHDHKMPEWARAERYDFCDGFYENHKSSKGNIFRSAAALLLSVF